MKSEHIQKLINAVIKDYGDIKFYGTNENEPYGTCFKINSINATFSIHSQDGKLKNSYDIQVEGIPAGDYVYTDELSLDSFMKLVRSFQKQETLWP